MIIGFGFGSPLVALLMLIITASISYTIFRAIKKSVATPSVSENNIEDYIEERREYYYQQRDKAYKMMQEFDLTDEEIEKKINDEL